MSRWFRQLAAEIGLDAVRTDDLELCLNELLANVLNYAYADEAYADERARPDDKIREIRIVAEGGAGDLRVSVEDDGRPFDPQAKPSPEPPGSLDRAGIGGWGLPIVRALASELVYERRGDWNRVTIRTLPTVSLPGSRFNNL